MRLGRLSGGGAFEVLVGARRAFGALIEVRRAFGAFVRAAVRSRHLSESARSRRVSEPVVRSGYARLEGRSAEGRAGLLLGQIRKRRRNQLELRVRAAVGAMPRLIREIFLELRERQGSDALPHAFPPAKMFVKRDRYARMRGV